jgi:hypothetical protein
MSACKFAYVERGCGWKYGCVRDWLSLNYNTYVQARYGAIIKCLGCLPQQLMLECRVGQNHLYTVYIRYFRL